VPEVTADFPRLFAEFTDPADADQLFRVDLTWLTSRWTCIFGSGCRGIVADRPDDGCCTHGAHFAEPADELHIRALAGDLGPEVWQLRATGLADGVAEDVPAEPADAADDDEPTGRRTRLVDGACVFLNRPGFAGGAGCALHLHALRTGVEPWTTKPEVCWQLPVRRTYETVVRPDSTAYLQINIEEYDRRGWGPGGADLDWYCSGNTEAHVGTTAVFESMAPELTELMGAAAYNELARICTDHLARGPVLLPHPADPVMLPMPTRR
jgi:hypothetical protein